MMFKIGQRVKCIQGSKSIVTGGFYIVTATSTDRATNLIMHIMVKGNENYWSVTRFVKDGIKKKNLPAWW
jgi:uncharacterized membrane protein